HRLVADSRGFNLIQGNHVFIVQSRYAPGVGFEIVDEDGRLDVQCTSQRSRIHDPGEGGRLNPAVAYRTRDAEAGGIGMHALTLQKFGYDLIESAVLPAGKDGFRKQVKMTILQLEKG